MAPEFADEFAVIEVPEQRQTAEADDARRRDEPPTVGREMHGRGLARERAERSRRSATSRNDARLDPMLFAGPMR